MITTALMIIVIAAALVPLIQRDLRRAVRRRRARLALRRIGRTSSQVAASFALFGSSAVKAAAAFEQAMARLSAAANLSRVQAREVLQDAVDAFREGRPR